MTIYHGGAKIKGEAKVPLFLYDNISTAIYSSTCYSSVDDKHISEFKFNKEAKILDLVANQEQGEKIINKIMKKIGLQFDDEYLYVKGSHEDLGLEVFGYDIDLAFYPEFRKELLKEGFNVLKTYTAFENSEPIAYAVLDASIISLDKEYSLMSDEGKVYLTVTQDNLGNSIGKSYSGLTGYGDIKLEEVKTTNRKKM